MRRLLKWFVLACFAVSSCGDDDPSSSDATDAGAGGATGGGEAGDPGSAGTSPSSGSGGTKSGTGGMPAGGSAGSSPASPSGGSPNGGAGNAPSDGGDGGTETTLAGGGAGGGEAGQPGAGSGGAAGSSGHGGDGGTTDGGSAGSGGTGEEGGSAGAGGDGPPACVETCAGSTVLNRCVDGTPEPIACSSDCLSRELQPGSCNAETAACDCGETVDIACWKAAVATCFCIVPDATSCPEDTLLSLYDGCVAQLPDAPAPCAADHLTYDDNDEMIGVDDCTAAFFCAEE